jgi:hypothetical protein
MNTQQAYINGFIKRAAQYGLNKPEALRLLKIANNQPDSAPFKHTPLDLSLGNSRTLSPGTLSPGTLSPGTLSPGTLSSGTRSFSKDLNRAAGFTPVRNKFAKTSINLMNFDTSNPGHWASLPVLPKWMKSLLSAKSEDNYNEKAEPLPERRPEVNR